MQRWEEGEWEGRLRGGKRGQIKHCSISAKQPAFYRGRNKQEEMEGEMASRETESEREREKEREKERERERQKKKKCGPGGSRGYCRNYQSATHAASPWPEIYFVFIFDSEIHHRAAGPLL